MKIALMLVLLSLTVTHPTLAKSKYFPSNYEASRTRFLQYESKLRDAYQKVESYEIRLGKEQLTVDTLFIPAQKSPKKLVIITSGTHGPEAYAGSALQALFVEEVLGKLNLDETGILLVHALNPWGFKHHRRDTENGVNLNRNFDVSADIFNIRNEGYEKLEELIELKGPVKSSFAYPAKNLLLEMLLKKDVTQQSLTEAISKGQYTSPKGLNYGGQNFETQTLEMIDLLKRIAPAYSAIFHIDIHTGLGDNGVLHVMTKGNMTEISQRAQDKLFNQTTDKGQYEITPPDTEGFYEPQGDYAYVLDKIMPEKDRVIIGITAEFGTVGNGLNGKITTINRLINENQGHHYGYVNENVKAKVQQKYLELFYPSNEEWKTKVESKGKYLLETVVQRFIAPAN